MSRQLKLDLHFIDVNTIVFFILSLVTTLFVFSDTVGGQYDVNVLSIYFMVCVLSLYGTFLSIDQHPYSLNKTFTIFNYFFFGIAPVVQFKYKSAFHGSAFLKPEQYTKTGIIILLCLICYLILYRFITQFFNKQKTDNYLEVEKKKEDNLTGCYILSVFSFVLFLILVKFDLNVMFKIPPVGWQKLNTKFGMIGYSLLLIVRAIPVIVLIYHRLHYKVIDKHSYILFLLLILTTFPFSLSRGTFATYYLPILLLYIPFLKRKIIYSLSYFVGVFFIFPILNFFRPSKYNKIVLGFDLFNSAHFDAFHNLAQLIDLKIITHGRQLLGSILFFVQESQWENRPVGTGQMLGELMGYRYTNISMPLWGEGYSNFGYIGIIIFLLFIILINSYLDYSFYNRKNNFFLSILFLFMLGFEFYLMRGDLYSSTKKFSSFVIALVLCFWTIRFIKSLLFLIKKSKKSR